MTDTELSLIWLDSVDELDYRKKRMLYDRIPYLGDLVRNFGRCEGIVREVLGEGIFRVLGHSVKSNAPERVLADLENRGIVPVTVESELYPDRLKETPLPPLVLYCKGNTKLLKTRMFTVVGSRRTPPDTVIRTRRIAEELSGHFTVVTGLAEGGDTAAAEGALKSGKLISVLAYGFDYIYPTVNKNLSEKIIEKGLLVTECIPSVSPKPYLFLIRNRILAGLSDGVLVVSAGKKSGALSTAEYAEEYGRQVFAFPYSIGVTAGVGCNFLIKSYGKLCENIVDICDMFGISFSKEESESPLSALEKRVLSCIADGKTHVAEIAAECKTTSRELMPVLSNLEIGGFIARMGGNRYSAIK